MSRNWLLRAARHAVVHARDAPGRSPRDRRLAARERNEEPERHQNSYDCVSDHAQRSHACRKDAIRPGGCRDTELRSLLSKVPANGLQEDNMLALAFRLRAAWQRERWEEGQSSPSFRPVGQRVLILRRSRRIGALGACTSSNVGVVRHDDVRALQITSSLCSTGFSCRPRARLRRCPANSWPRRPAAPAPREGLPRCLANRRCCRHLLLRQGPSALRRLACSDCRSTVFPASPGRRPTRRRDLRNERQQVAGVRAATLPDAISSSSGVSSPAVGSIDALRRVTMAARRTGSSGKSC